MYKLIDEKLVKEFGDEYEYESNTFRMLDALQWYLQGVRSDDDIMEQLCLCNYEGCEDDSGNEYISQEAFDDVKKFFNDFNEYGAEELFNIKED